MIIVFFKYSGISLNNKILFLLIILIEWELRVFENSDENDNNANGQ